MCGIVAIINVSSAKERLVKALKKIEHRGDISDPVYEVSNKIALGTRRLRILDWENAIQPMISYNNQFVVVYNGEIYNYKDLRIDLEKKGIKFNTESDTEVLANGLAYYGVRFLPMLNGMFAFVAYNLRENSFIASRDTAGIKPLYFIKYEHGFCFASEIKPLLFVTDLGIVQEVKPGQIISNNGNFHYETITSDFRVGSLKQNAKNLARLLESSIARQVPSTQEFAIKFGGGIDSTLILHLASKYSKNIKSYLISNENGIDKKYALEYAQRCGADPIIINFSEQDIYKLIKPVVSTIESFEPTLVRNSIFSFLLSKRISDDGIKIALCGEGADELFLGYREMESYKENMDYQIFYKDLYRTQLQRVDRCSMQFHLETRVPFLDENIVFFSKNIPISQKIGKYEGTFTNKIILRELFKLFPEIPESIRLRDKVVLVEGAGMGNNSKFSGPFYEHSNSQMTDEDFKFSKKKYSKFFPTTKEEVLYLNVLENTFDIKRVENILKRPMLNKM
ncbi:MAG: Glutamine amidotransferase type-2 protein [Ignavibacteria bacterium]|nr:Glutamine amidotransferase type-2 protein [Ignavibacteria bacterium]